MIRENIKGWKRRSDELNNWGNMLPGVSVWLKRIPVNILIFITMVMGIYIISEQRLVQKSDIIISTIIIIVCEICGLVFICRDIWRALHHHVFVASTEEGLYMKNQIIAWDRIKEFRLKKNQICVIVNDLEEVLMMSNPIIRLFKKGFCLKYGTIYVIDFIEYPGSGKKFIAYLEEERKRYTEKKKEKFY